MIEQNLVGINDNFQKIYFYEYDFIYVDDLYLGIVIKFGLFLRVQGIIVVKVMYYNKILLVIIEIFVSDIRILLNFLQNIFIFVDFFMILRLYIMVSFIFFVIV